jgi:hypothetical protein
MNNFSKYKELYGMLRWKENNTWIVACQKFDVISQGSTLEEAWHRWTSSFALTSLHHNVEAPPPDVLNKWILNHERFNIESDSSIN